ncbi:hypothetical protein SELSPUOL_02612 [Selenomonas sputigena ATCC 35185]|uniref:Uncharacterized protein n=1 Tax=Selenomonas sputigena (strain ATCC 35185 / DSM 20758 / CCUG 44933 / VPI D19B-28) TaxID=546271 RepID=C9LYQ1_SELS3|nr:hypothetical protein SELSPUOL_02612 [Selenomonas sputigena ATCC 35185]
MEKAGRTGRLFVNGIMKQEKQESSLHFGRILVREALGEISLREDSFCERRVDPSDCQCKLGGLISWQTRGMSWGWQRKV